MTKISLSLNKTLEQNAAVYFEKAKKAKKKLEGTLNILQISQQKRKKMLEEDLMDQYDQAEIEKIKQQKHERTKEQWYEKFRWFITSEGFLVVGGRDATSNEIIIKKHAEKNDIVFHTDMAGSPFLVIKVSGNDSTGAPGEASLQEAANATFTFSRAVKLGLSTSSVFWVRPDQVTKEANTGEYLTKGAFVIRGKTNYVYPSFDLAIGITKEGKIMCGPKSAVKKNCVKS
ncbi:TPA: DUF814 domain-containing protein, partial [Candidatus Woesearchaeota archaeon]|nr:DUF814 domain-containing protein [Candidatus Woesearchaeota archaeon]